MEDLQTFLEAHAIITLESTRKYFKDDVDDMPIARQRTLIHLCNTFTCVAAKKLVKYLADNHEQPAIAFLKCCRIFNPARVALLLHNKMITILFRTFLKPFLFMNGNCI